MADTNTAADTTEVVTVEEGATIETLKEAAKEVVAEAEDVVSSENLDEEDDDETTTEELNENGSEAKPTENGTAKEATNGSSEAEAEKVENGNGELKRKSEGGVAIVDSADEITEKKAKLEEIVDGKAEDAPVEVSSNGDSELVV